MKIFGFPRKKPLSADVIALLAQAHSIHRAELEFAKDQLRAELRQQVRDALMDEQVAQDMMGRSSPAAALDSLRIRVGLLFSETDAQRSEWVKFVKDCRVAKQDAEYEELHRRLHKGYSGNGASYPAGPVRYASGGTAPAE